MRQMKQSHWIEPKFSRWWRWAGWETHFRWVLRASRSGDWKSHKHMCGFQGFELPDSVSFVWKRFRNYYKSNICTQLNIQLLPKTEWIVALPLSPTRLPVPFSLIIIYLTWKILFLCECKLYTNDSFLSNTVSILHLLFFFHLMLYLGDLFIPFLTAV